MVTIALIILIPVIAIIVGFFTLKAYNLGLTQSFDIKHEARPKEGIGMKNPLSYYADKKQEKQEDIQAQEDANIMSEWLHGAERK